MTNRAEVLNLLQALPVALIAENDEVMRFLRERRLYGRGLGWIDIHLLVSVSLSQAVLWTNDRELRRAAEAQLKQRCLLKIVRRTLVRIMSEANMPQSLRLARRSDF
jgi:hypothetical protein